MVRLLFLYVLLSLVVLPFALPVVTVVLPVRIDSQNLMVLTVVRMAVSFGMFVVDLVGCWISFLIDCTSSKLI